MSYTYDIFLSHNGADKPWTEKLAYDIENDTEGRPLKVFFDKWDIKPGANLPEELEKGLTGSRFLGLVMTPQAFKSDWVVLERSTAVIRDPAAKLRTIIPLLRKSCNIPSILSPLIYIDFTDDNNYNDELQKLINVLRDKEVKRGGQKSFETVYLQEDKRLLENHLIIFQRPAFRLPCIQELSFSEVISAIDDTQAAINTGKLFGRNKNLLSEFPSMQEYKTESFKEGFNQVVMLLTDLKRALMFSRLSGQDYFMFTLFKFVEMGDKMVIQKLVNDMDMIDTLRNRILVILNSLLNNSKQYFPLITKSSEVVKTSTYHRYTEIASYL